MTAHALGDPICLERNFAPGELLLHCQNLVYLLLLYFLFGIPQNLLERLFLRPLSQSSDSHRSRFYFAGLLKLTNVRTHGPGDKTFLNYLFSIALVKCPERCFRTGLFGFRHRNVLEVNDVFILLLGLIVFKADSYLLGEYTGRLRSALLFLLDSAFLLSPFQHFLSYHFILLVLPHHSVPLGNVMVYPLRVIELV